MKIRSNILLLFYIKTVSYDIFYREVEILPNIKSAKKRVNVTKKKTLKNRMFKTMYKTTLKKFEVAVAEGDKAAAESAYRNAVSVIDRAACKGIIHTNAAARKKSRFAKKLNTL